MSNEDLTSITKKRGVPGRPKKVDMWRRKDPTHKVAALWDRILTDFAEIQNFEALVVRTADDREDYKMAIQRMSTSIVALQENLTNMRLVLMWKHPEPLRVM